MDLHITINATPEEARGELARWLDSGEYSQATGTLCRRMSGVESYCCLGVASEIGVALGLVGKTIEQRNNDDIGDAVTYGGEDEVLGYVLQTFFGLTATGEFRIGVSCGELTNLNDHDIKFSQIAEYVRNADFVLPPLKVL